MSPFIIIGIILGIITIIAIIFSILLFAASSCSMSDVKNSDSPFKYFLYCSISSLVWT